MRGSIETLPSSVLQEILNGRLGAVDLARLESCSSMFRAPCGITPCVAKSIAEAAAHHSCETHPVFENLPPRARLALLVRCDGHWKQVLYFLECLLLMRGHSAPTGSRSNVSAGFFSLQLLPLIWHLFLVRVLVEHLSMVRSCKCLGVESQVVATAGLYHSLIVNGKGEIYITSGPDEIAFNALCRVYSDIAPEPQSTLRLIFSQPTANRILQISANYSHAAFVTETGQVTKSFLSLKHGSEMNVKP
jgi:hypothetical protein